MNFFTIARLVYFNLAMTFAILLLSVEVSACDVENRRPFISAAASLGSLTLLHSARDFFVVKDGRLHKVESYLVDKDLRSRSSAEIAKFLEKNYIRIKHSDDEKFSLVPGYRALGGGAGGATVGFFGGKAAVHLVGHGSIWLVSRGIDFILPGAGVATQIVLEGVLSIPIETASNVVALGAGIALGAATGPV